MTADQHAGADRSSPRRAAADAPPDAGLGPVLEARVTALLQAGGRRLLGIAGAPGAGKSTLAAQVARAFPEVVVVPMDGFHLAQTELERLGRADRKGAPDTFDAAGYVALLRRLREPAGETVYAPEYRRDLRNGVAGAIAVPPGTALVVTEGNYLLVDDAGFGPVRALLDEAWFVAPDDDTRRERLVARHVAFGKAPDAAHAWTHGPDERNAVLVAASADRADVLVGPGGVTVRD